MAAQRLSQPNVDAGLKSLSPKSVSICEKLGSGQPTSQAATSLRCLARNKFVITRHLMARTKLAATPMAVAFAEIRQHRQKQHTKRAGEAGVSARAEGVGQEHRNSSARASKPPYRS